MEIEWCLWISRLSVVETRLKPQVEAMGQQRRHKRPGIDDSVDLFTSDTLKGGAKKPEVVKILCGNSGADVDWLVDKFNLDLSLMARLGGHSEPRTHC